MQRLMKVVLTVRASELRHSAQVGVFVNSNITSRVMIGRDHWSCLKLMFGWHCLEGSGCRG